MGIAEWLQAVNAELSTVHWSVWALKNETRLFVLAVIVVLIAFLSGCGVSGPALYRFGDHRAKAEKVQGPPTHGAGEKPEIISKSEWCIGWGCVEILRAGADLITSHQPY